MMCPTCREPIDAHNLKQAYACLEVLAAAARELAARACGGAVVAALEREMMRPSANWRT